MRERPDDEVVDRLLIRGQLCLDRGGILLGDSDGPRLSLERLEMTDVALMQLSVEGLFLEEPVARIRSDRDADIAEDLGWLPAGLGGTLLDVITSPPSLLRSHPVQEDAVRFGTGQRAHLRSHRRDRHASAPRQG